MTRAIWKAYVQFGPVHVPVKLYAAVTDVRAHSHLLHDKDRQRLEMRMVCSAEDVPVKRDEIIKGYPVEKGEYIPVEAEELEALVPGGSRQIEVVEFVPSGQVDPRYRDRTYYLGPDRDDGLYLSLLESLRHTDLAGVCRWVMRRKSYLGLLEFDRGVLTLMTCRYADEVVREEDLRVPEEKVTAKEQRAAMELVGALTEKFNPEEYRDDYEVKLKNLIERKARGEEVRLPRARKIARTAERNLLADLEKSLAAVRGK